MSDIPYSKEEIGRPGSGDPDITALVVRLGAVQSELERVKDLAALARDHLARGQSGPAGRALDQIFIDPSAAN